MRSVRMLPVAALGVMLGALSPRPAGAQLEPRPLPWTGTRPALELGYTQLRFDVARGTPLRAEGVGGRLMWNLAGVTGREGGLAARTGVGLFATFAPQQRFGGPARVSTTTAGAAADVRPLAAPLFGRVDPFLSLGAGALRTSRSAGLSPSPSPLMGDARTSFTLTPGVGTTLQLGRQLALQGEVRDFVTFRDAARHNVALGAGLRLAF